MLNIRKLTVGCATFLACVYGLNGAKKNFKTMSIADFKNYLHLLACGKTDENKVFGLWDDASEKLKKDAREAINKRNNYNKYIFQANNGQLENWFQEREQEGRSRDGLIKAWENSANDAWQQYLSIVEKDRREHFQTLNDSISEDYMLPWQQKVARIFVAEWTVSAANNRSMQDNNNLWSGEDNQTLRGFETIYDANKNKDSRKEIMSLFRENEDFDAFKTRFALDDQTDADTIRIVQQLYNLYTNFNKQNKENEINIQDAFDAIGTPFKTKSNKKAVLALLSENVTVDTLKDVYLLNDQDDAKTIQRLQQISALYGKIKDRNPNANIQDFWNLGGRTDDFWVSIDNLHTAIEGKDIDYLKNFHLLQVYKNELALYGLTIDGGFNFNDEDIAKLRELGQYSPFFLKWLFFPANGSAQLFEKYKNKKETFYSLDDYLDSIDIPELKNHFDNIRNAQGNNIFMQNNMLLYPSVFWFILKDERIRNRHPLLQPRKIENYDTLLTKEGFKEHLSYVANRDMLERELNAADWLTVDERKARIVWLKMVCEPHFDETINSLRDENNPWKSMWNFIRNKTKETDNLLEVLTSEEGLAFVHKNLPAKAYHCLKAISVMEKGLSWGDCTDLFEEGLNYDNLERNKDFQPLIKKPANIPPLQKALNAADWLTVDERKARIGWLKMVCEPHFDGTINSLRDENNPWESMWNFIRNKTKETDNLLEVLTSEEGLAFVHKNLPAKAYHCLKAISVMGLGLTWSSCTDLFEKGLNYDNLGRNKDFQNLIKTRDNINLLVKALNAADWLTNEEKNERIEFVRNGGKKAILDLKTFISEKYFQDRDNIQISDEEKQQMINFTDPCIANRNKAHEVFSMLKRFAGNLNEAQLTNLAFSTLYRFMGTFYSGSDDDISTDEDIQNLIAAIGLNELYSQLRGDLGNRLAIPYDFSGKRGTIVSHCGELMEAAYLKYFCEARVQNGITDWVDKDNAIRKTEYENFIRGLFGKLFKNLGEYAHSGQFKTYASFWDGDNIDMFSGGTKNTMLTIFELMEATLFVYNSQQANARLKNDCKDLAFQIFQSLFHFSVHCDSGRALAIKTIADRMVQACLLIRSEKNNVLNIWNQYYNLVEKSLVNDFDMAHETLFGIDLIRGENPVYIECSYNEGLMANCLSFKYLDVIEDYSEGHFVRGKLQAYNEAAMIVGTLPALLGGWKDVNPDNFYGSPVQSYNYITRGTAALVTTMCYYLVQGSDPFKVHALNAYYRLRRAINNPGVERTYRLEGYENFVVKAFDPIELTEDSLKEFVQTTFGACFDADFMLSQMVPDQETLVALSETQQAFVTICDSFLENILGPRLTVDQKRNALRYLFLKHGFFQRH